MTLGDAAREGNGIAADGTRHVPCDEVALVNALESIAVLLKDAVCASCCSPCIVISTSQRPDRLATGVHWRFDRLQRVLRRQHFDDAPRHDFLVAVASMAADIEILAVATAFAGRRRDRRRHHRRRPARFAARLPREDLAASAPVRPNCFESQRSDTRGLRLLRLAPGSRTTSAVMPGIFVTLSAM